MKRNLYSIILILALVFSCENNHKLEGYYSTCDGDYTEVYFKQDSMRVAADNEWVKLSEWRKIEIKEDTLYFTSFGELSDNYRVTIEYIGNNKIEFCNIDTDYRSILEPIKENINFENEKKFWKGFYKRQNSKTCEKRQHIK